MFLIMCFARAKRSIVYTREQLIEIGNQVSTPGQKLCVSADLHSQVNRFHLLRASPTKRGKRGGSRKQKTKKNRHLFSVKFGLLNVCSIAKTVISFQ